MHDASVAIFLAGIATVGAIPIVILVGWLVRRRDADGAPRPARAAAAALTVAAVLALGGGGYVLVSSRQPGVPAGEGDMAGMPGMPASGANPAASAAQGPSLPSSIAGLPRTSDVTGTEALRQVNQLHGTDVPLVAASIGSYAGTSGKAELWVAVASQAAGAADMVQRMADGIAKGGSPFEKPWLLSERTGVWVTRGMGQIHYFFARGANAWWVSVDADFAQRALEEALAAAGPSSSAP